MKAIVKDTLAEPGKARVHQIITKMGPDGKTPAEIQTVQLRSDQGTEMEMDHAMQFLKDKAFIVTDAEGNRVEPVPVQKDGGTGSLVLKPNEVIADLNELTTRSLYKRCKVIAGSDKIVEGTEREDMVDFLMRRAGAQDIAQKTDVAEAMAAAGVDQMDSKSLDALFDENA